MCEQGTSELYRHLCEKQKIIANAATSLGGRQLSWKVRKMSETRQSWCYGPALQMVSNNGKLILMVKQLLKYMKTRVLRHLDHRKD